MRLRVQYRHTPPLGMSTVVALAKLFHWESRTSKYKQGCTIHLAQMS